MNLIELHDYRLITEKLKSSWLVDTVLHVLQSLNASDVSVLIIFWAAQKIHTETGSARSSDCRTVNTGPTFSCFLLRLSSSLSLLQITLKNAFWFLRSFRGVGTSNAWSTIASNICHTTYDNEVKYRYTQQSTHKVYFIFFFHHKYSNENPLNSFSFHKQFKNFSD